MKNQESYNLLETMSKRFRIEVGDNASNTTSSSKNCKYRSE